MSPEEVRRNVITLYGKNSTDEERQAARDALRNVKGSKDKVTRMRPAVATR